MQLNAFLSEDADFESPPKDHSDIALTWFVEKKTFGFLSMGLPVLHISYKWNQTTCGLLCLVSLIEHRVFEVPCISFWLTEAAFPRLENSPHPSQWFYPRTLTSLPQQSQTSGPLYLSSIWQSRQAQDTGSALWCVFLYHRDASPFFFFLKNLRLAKSCEYVLYVLCPGRWQGISKCFSFLHRPMQITLLCITVSWKQSRMCAYRNAQVHGEVVKVHGESLKVHGESIKLRGKFIKVHGESTKVHAASIKAKHTGVYSSLQPLHSAQNPASTKFNKNGS